MGYLILKPSNKQQYYLTHSWGDKKFHTFLKSISPKVNIITLLEFKLTYFKAAILYFRHCTTETHSLGSLPLLTFYKTDDCLFLIKEFFLIFIYLHLNYNVNSLSTMWVDIELSGF